MASLRKALVKTWTILNIHVPTKQREFLQQKVLTHNMDMGHFIFYCENISVMLYGNFQHITSSVFSQYDNGTPHLSLLYMLFNWAAHNDMFTFTIFVSSLDSMKALKGISTLLKWVVIVAQQLVCQYWDNHLIY